MSEIYIPLLPALAVLFAAVAIGCVLGYRAGMKRVARHIKKVTLSPSLWSERGPKP